MVRDALAKFQPENSADEPDNGATASDSLFRFECRGPESSQPLSLFHCWTNWSEGSSAILPDMLKDAYIHYNTTLPSSAAVERLLSLGKRVLSPTRSLLGDDAFEWMVVIPCAKKYLNNH